MNSLLQKHGCANVFTIPEGLKELMSDITREILRDQPPNILEYISGYLWALLITREHGLLAVKILEDLCDCRPTLEERLRAVGMTTESTQECAKIIQQRFEDFKPIDGEKLKEKDIVKKLLGVVELDAEQAANVCHIIQEVYLDYYQKKQSLQETIAESADEPWKVAAQRTIDIYKTTRPTFDELVRASEKIQAAYRGYHVRRQMIKHLESQSVAHEESITTALDLAGSREIDLGPKMTVLMDADEVASVDASLHEKTSATSRSVTLKFESQTSTIDRDTRGRTGSVQFSSHATVAEILRESSLSETQANGKKPECAEQRSDPKSSSRDDFDQDVASETAISTTSETISEALSTVGEDTENEEAVDEAVAIDMTADMGSISDEAVEEETADETFAGDTDEEMPEEIEEQQITDSEVETDDLITTDGEEAD